MKFIKVALLGAMCFAASVQAGLDLCDGKDHDFSFEDVNYEPSPLTRTGEVRVSIQGTLKTAIPNDAKLRFTIKPEGHEERKWDIDFYSAVKNPSNTVPLQKNSDPQTVIPYFYFPGEFQYLKGDDFDVEVSAHKKDSTGRDVRIFCVHGTLRVPL